MAMIEDIIGDLLLRYNCVILPTFGGFVTKPVSAKIDFDRGTMTPPGKALLFNKQLINNDGLIISELAHRTKQTFEEAELLVKDQLAMWNDELAKGGRVEIDRVGLLYLDNEQNVGFEQDRFSNLLLESFGLGAVNFISEREEVEIVKEKEPVELTKETKIIPITKESTVNTALNNDDSSEAQVEIPQLKSKGRKIRRYIAAACILPIAFYTIWIPTKTNILESGIVSFRDFNPFLHSTEGTYNPDSNLKKQIISDENVQEDISQSIQGLPQEVQVYSYKLDESRFIPVKVKKNDNQTFSEPSSAEVFNPEAMNYIVGCFSVESNATNLVEKLNANGLNAHIVDFHNGLHRVSAGEALSQESLSELKTKVENLGYRGWILK